MRRPILLVTLVAGLLAAGCGSTVASTGQAGTGLYGAPDGLTAAPGGPGSETAATGADQLDTSAGPAVDTTGSTSTDASGSTGTGSAAAGAPPPGAALDAAGRGSTAPIPLSYVILDSSGTSAFTLFTGNDPNSSTRAAREEMTALVKWANANGGVGGRPIVAKGTTVAATSSQEERQAVCAKMTEDEKAQVVIDVTVMIRPDQFSCFAKHKTVLSTVATTTDRKVMAEFAPYLMTTWSALDPQLVALSDAALALEWAKGAKVGIVYNDDLPEVRRNVDTVLIPRLTAGGVEVVERQGMAGRSEDAALASNQAAGAVLRFRQKGVTRIFFVAGTIEYLAFTGQAKSQSYQPAYAFPDYQVISGVAAFYGTEQDNANAIAVSTSSLVIKADNSRKSTDLTSDADRESASPGQRRCLDLMTRLMGRNYYKPSSSGSSQFESYYCEHFLSWLDAARTLGAAWEPARHGEAMRRLADRYPSVLNNSVDWATGRADGASSFRAGRYDARCKCFVGVGPWRALP